MSNQTERSENESMAQRGLVRALQETFGQEVQWKSAQRWCEEVAGEEGVEEQECHMRYISRGQLHHGTEEPKKAEVEVHLAKTNDDEEWCLSTGSIIFTQNEGMYLWNFDLAGNVTVVK